jgi:hypothetical protein
MASVMGRLRGSGSMQRVFKKGRRFQLRAGRALRDDIVDIWTREAKKTGQPED